MAAALANTGGTGTCIVVGERIARYAFGDGHPFGSDRHDAFTRELSAEGLDRRVLALAPRAATRGELELFHLPAYIDLVQARSLTGEGYLDAGDTPAFKGVYEAACDVVGASLVATEALMSGQARRAFVPIAGLHHASRGHAAGFCVFNDCGVVVEHLKRAHGVERIAYVDIDAHHGDGVYYSFEDDPALIFADLHEDGRYLYPGTGASEESGTGSARGTKLNLPLPPGAGDREFLEAWASVEAHLERHRPQFVIFQCGADSLEGDPITHLRLTEEAHAHAAMRLCQIADRFASGRILGVGGGGYNRRNLARAWTRVVRAFVEAA
ncbi:MAG: histone deacetylase [Steroidobacteraceae bacterium]|nr:histone deacetylase [Steroidobacteraceae bacterium]MBM2853928.1 histone deacetylase [Steroidobacteraceae bacterium]